MTKEKAHSDEGSSASKDTKTKPFEELKKREGPWKAGQAGNGHSEIRRAAGTKFEIKAVK